MKICVIFVKKSFHFYGIFVVKIRYSICNCITLWRFAFPLKKSPCRLLHDFDDIYAVCCRQ